MTDITDQATRDMIEWARIAVASKGNQEREPWVTAARYILANVPAPAPTLAEELLYRADILDNGDPDGDTPHALRTLAARAEQMEQDAEDRQEWNRRITEQVATLTAERDEAHAEVERLTAERYEKEVLDAIDALYDRYAVQERAESNAETPNPADVQPGEAWLVECRGERRFAAKDRTDYLAWNTVSDDGLVVSEGNDDVTLIARIVLAPRVITNPEEIDQAKRLTVIRDGVGIVCERAALGDGWFTTGNGVDQTPYIKLPATVIWEPGA